MAAPKVPIPGATTPFPMLSDADIQKQANAQVQAALAAQAAPITSARQQAAAASAANQAALQGFGQATAGLEQGIGPGMQAGYDQAAQSVADLAGGFSAGTADRVRAAQAASDAFVNSQVKGAGPTGIAPNANNLQDTLYALGGYIPGASLEAQGAAANAFGQALPGIEDARTQQNVLAEQAAGSQQDKQYEQQLIDLAAKRPDLMNQVLDQLYQRELDKFNANQGAAGQAEQVREFNVNQAFQKQQAGIQQTQWEKQFGLTRDQFNEQVSEFQKNYGLSAADAAEKVREFNVSNQQFAKQFGLSVDQFNEQVNEFKKQHGLDVIQATNQVKQFNKSLGLQVKQMLSQNKQWKTEDQLNAGQQAEQRREFDQTFAQNATQIANQYQISLGQLNIQQQAQDLYDSQFGETVRHNKVEEGQGQQGIDVQKQQIAVQLKQLKITSAYDAAKIEQAALAGQAIDPSASRVVGHLVDQNNNPIVNDQGNVIPVHVAPKPSDVKKQYQSAVGDAKSLRGSAVANKSVGPLSPGAYVARSGVKGSDVFPGKAGLQPTTNNPAKAQLTTSMTFADAQAYLMQRRGLTRAQARRALVAAGWKPDGQRPKQAPAPTSYPARGYGDTGFAAAGFPLAPTTVG